MPEHVSDFLTMSRAVCQLLPTASGRFCVPNMNFFDFFVVLPCVRLLALSDVARADSRAVFGVVLRL